MTGWRAGRSVGTGAGYTGAGRMLAAEDSVAERMPELADMQERPRTMERSRTCWQRSE